MAAKTISEARGLDEPTDASRGAMPSSRPAPPKRRIRVGLSFKVAALMGLLLAVTVGAVYVQVERTLRDSLTSQILDKGRALVSNLRANASEARASGDDLLVGTYVDKLLEEKGVMYAAVYDAEGLVIAHSDTTKAKGTKVYGAPPKEGEPPRPLGAGDAIVYEFVAPLAWQGQALGTAQLGLSATIVKEQVQAVRRTVAIVSGSVLVGGLVLAWLLVTLMLRPVRALARAADIVGSGNFEHRVTVRSRDELGALAETFNSMAEHLKGVQATVVEREKSQQQVDIAREIAESLLPTSVPKLSGFELEVVTRAGAASEGEYYDFIDVAPTQLGVVMADVYDSGIHRAVNLAKVRSLMRYQAMGNNVASSVLSGVNFLLYRERMSVRMIYALLDTQARSISLASAGYLPALAYEASSRKLSPVQPGGMAMGLDMGSNFNYFIKNRLVPLATGDVVVWISAGAATILERKKRDVLETNVANIIQTTAGAAAKQVAQAVDSELRRTVGDMLPNDAYVVIVLKALEKPAEVAAVASPSLRPGTFTTVPAAPPRAGG